MDGIKRIIGALLILVSTSIAVQWLLGGVIRLRCCLGNRELTSRWFRTR